jgi:hypothetical protein
LPGAVMARATLFSASRFMFPSIYTPRIAPRDAFVTILA